MATELGVNLVGDAAQRRAGQTAAGEFACFECGDTTRLMKDCVIYLERKRTIEVRSLKKNGGAKGTKGKRSEKGKKSYR